MIGLNIRKTVLSLLSDAKLLKGAVSPSPARVLSSPGTLSVADHNRNVFVEATLTVPATLPEGFSCRLFNRTGASKTISGTGINMYQAGSSSATGLDDCVLNAYGQANLVIVAGKPEIFGNLSES